MRALVVYESMYGSTHVIADNVADGLRGDYEVTVVPVGEATPELVAAADLVVAGAPTHLRGLSTAKSRQMAAQAAVKGGSGLRDGPGRRRPGHAGRLKDLGHRDGLAAAFDTRVNGIALLTGRASRPIARLLKRHGYRLVAAPEGFLVCRTARCSTARPHRARRWHDHRRGEQDVPACARMRSASSSPVGARYDEDRPVGMVQGGHGHAAEHDLLHGGSASGSDDQ